MDDKLSFNEHVEMISRKSYQMLGFIFRCGKYFRSKLSLMVLYNGLVRNRLEYCSSVWNPQYNNAIDQIEKIQKKFTRMLYFKFNLGNARPSYDVRLQNLKKHSLESRRLENDEITLFRIMHNYIDSRSLTQKLSYQQPARFTRRNQYTPNSEQVNEYRNQIFYLPKMSTNYEENAPMNRIQKNHDKYFSTVNIFDSRLSRFKAVIKSFFGFWLPYNLNLFFYFVNQ